MRADMVTYGKTLGGGLPVGVLCGSRELMKRYRSDRPTDICFARGTFNTHPYVMGSMNEFLHHVTSDDFRERIAAADALWNDRAASLNERLQREGLPLKIHNLSSIWTITYTQIGRFNWLLQYYLRAEGLALSWVGTGRLIFSHNYTDEEICRGCGQDRKRGRDHAGGRLVGCAARPDEQSDQAPGAPRNAQCTTAGSSSSSTSCSIS